MSDVTRPHRHLVGGLHAYHAFPGATHIVMTAAWLLVSPSTMAAPPQERLAYWKSTYGELSPTADTRAQRAHDIFQRVRRAAGTRPGVEPRLLITQHDPLGLSLPIAIPDGSIIISPKTLALCYRDAKRGDDRLAFVLGHEIAHQLKGDFWHMQFFQALEASKATPPGDQTALSTFRSLLRQMIGRQPPPTDEYGLIYTARELQADDYGIVYAALAGFNPNAIVTEDGRVNFFADWLRALNPNRLQLLNPSPLSPVQRAETVKQRLRTILDQVEVFYWGVRFYQVGDYPKAILAFNDFLQAFPSPEVYHNVALSHHQLALQEACGGKRNRSEIPFKLILSLDPQTRASLISLTAEQRSLNVGHMDQAIEFYQRASLRDPSYHLVYNNLGVAFLQMGKVYKAIATLQDGLAVAPNLPELHNHLGVAFFLAGQPSLARQHLLKARSLAPTFDAPPFNLGVLAHQQGRQAEAKTHWQAYLALDPVSAWAEVIRQPRTHALPCSGLRDIWLEPSSYANEHMMGVSVEARDEDVPAHWGQPSQITPLGLQADADALVARRYPHGILTLSHLGEIQILGAITGYRGKSAKGVRLNSTAEYVRQRYGAPTQVLRMLGGANWTYDTHGIAFQIQHGKVVSWLLY